MDFPFPRTGEAFNILPLFSTHIWSENPRVRIGTGAWTNDLILLALALEDNTVTANT